MSRTQVKLLISRKYNLLRLGEAIGTIGTGIVVDNR